MVITGIAAAVSAMPVAGILADRGVPLLPTFGGLAVLTTGLVFAAQAVYGLNNLAASWVMQVRWPADEARDGGLLLRARFWDDRHVAHMLHRHGSLHGMVGSVAMHHRLPASTQGREAPPAVPHRMHISWRQAVDT